MELNKHSRFAPRNLKPPYIIRFRPNFKTLGLISYITLTNYILLDNQITPKILGKKQNPTTKNITLSFVCMFVIGLMDYKT